MEIGGNWWEFHQFQINFQSIFINSHQFPSISINFHQFSINFLSISIKFHQFSIKFHQIKSNSIIFYGNRLEIDIDRKSIGNRWKSIGIDGNWWKSMGIDWKLIGNWWKLMEWIDGNWWKLMQLIEFHQFQINFQ